MSIFDSVDILLFFLKDFIVYLFYIYDIFGHCRYDNLKHPMHRPFFCNPHFYPSPPKSWHLPPYADGMAIQFAQRHYRTTHSTKTIRRQLEYVDDEAVESNAVASCNDKSIDLDSFSELGSSFISDCADSKTLSSSDCHSPQDVSS